MTTAAPGLYAWVPEGCVAAIVTYLEMRAPPVLTRESPPALDLSLADMPHPDPHWYRRLYRAVGEPWLWFSRLRLDDEALTAIIHDPGVEIAVLRCEDREIGLLELDRRDPEQVELAFFGVVPEAIGSGAAGWLMRRAMERVWEREPRPARFWVHTCTLDHPRALGFYRHYGFEPYAQAIEVTDDPRLDGTLPVTAAPDIPVNGAPPAC